MALLVAQTRVEAGVHSTLEVAYGGLLGALVTLVLFQLFSMTRRPRALRAGGGAPRRRAYAPYSEYLVGAAVRARDGRVFEGVNVENAAYPLGVCAEKTALRARSRDGCRPGDLEAIAITASPCGGCRQWLASSGSTA